jgi:hypothetical protein
MQSWAEIICGKMKVKQGGLDEKIELVCLLGSASYFGGWGSLP